MTPRARHLLQCFRLTEERWKKIWDFQGGLCGICKRPLKKANTDHNHISGEVRGLLCSRCNRALGRFSDSLVLILAAAEFLKNPPAREALGGPHYGLPGRVNTKKQRKLAKKLAKEEALAKAA